QRGGLHEGDTILSVEGEKYDDMMVLVSKIRKMPGSSVRFLIERHDQKKELTLKVGQKESHVKKIVYLGFQLIFPQWPSWSIETEKYSILSAWAPAFNQMVSLIQFNAIIIGKILTGKVSVHTLGGPISIVQFAGQASLQSYRVYFSFLAF